MCLRVKDMIKQGNLHVINMNISIPKSSQSVTMNWGNLTYITRGYQNCVSKFSVISKHPQVCLMPRKSITNPSRAASMKTFFSGCSSKHNRVNQQAIVQCHGRYHTRLLKGRNGEPFSPTHLIFMSPVFSFKNPIVTSYFNFFLPVTYLFVRGKMQSQGLDQQYGQHVVLFLYLTVAQISGMEGPSMGWHGYDL